MTLNQRTDIKLSKEEKLEQSHKINRNLIKERTFKCSRISDWSLFQSEHLEKELNGNRSKSFPLYKPGTIVHLNLGVNIGHEFSGDHFAITLSRHDSTSKGTIMVIPLTTKKGPDRIELSNTIFDHRYTYLKEKHHVSKYTLEFIDGEADTVKRMIKFLENKYIPSIIRYGVVRAAFNNQYNRVTGMKPTKDITMAEMASAISSELENKSEDLNILLDEVEKELNLLEKMTQKTYALPLQVRAISKDRVTKDVVRNQGLSHIVIENEQLKKIRNILRKEFA